MFFSQSTFFSLLQSITSSHDQPWVCIVNSDLCILSLKMRGHSAVTNILVLSMNCFLTSISVWKSNLFYFISCLGMILAIDFSTLVKYMIFLNFFGLITAFTDVDFSRIYIIRRNYNKGISDIFLGKEKHHS